MHEIKKDEKTCRYTKQGYQKICVRENIIRRKKNVLDVIYTRKVEYGKKYFGKANARAFKIKSHIAMLQSNQS